MYFWYTDHSEECNILYEHDISIPSNFNNNIKIYEDFKKSLIEYLNKNPIINYSNFRKYATDLYYKTKCTFEIKNYTFCNIYYSWRKTSNIFNKYSIFKNKYTKENKTFLRDYVYKLIYNDKGNKYIEHEHVIFISNFFL